jgi:hypothetical protein
MPRNSKFSTQRDAHMLVHTLLRALFKYIPTKPAVRPLSNWKRSEK